MSEFEEIGRQHIINQIEALEDAQPGWLPMFYMTCTYDGDLRAAELLREKYDMPRPSKVSARISRDKTKYSERAAIAQAENDHHEQMMRTDWVYWIADKLGFHRKGA